MWRLLPLGLLLTGCLPAAWPRTGDVAAPGHLTGEAGLQVVNYEPERVTLKDGRRLKSDYAWYPAIPVALRAGLPYCEVGGAYILTRFLAEGRCGLWQEADGAPVSLAGSAALGFDYGPYFGFVARVGLDFSTRLGPLHPLIDLYLSQNTAMRYIEDPGDPPIEGPLPGSKSTFRDETRLTVPVGLSIDVAEVGEMKERWSIVLGAMPFLVLRTGPCSECDEVKTWDADRGVGFTLGVEAH